MYLFIYLLFVLVVVVVVVVVAVVVVVCLHSTGNTSAESACWWNWVERAN